MWVHLIIMRNAECGMRASREDVHDLICQLIKYLNFKLKLWSWFDTKDILVNIVNYTYNVTVKFRFNIYKTITLIESAFENFVAYKSIYFF